MPWRRLTAGAILMPLLPAAGLVLTWRAPLLARDELGRLLERVAEYVAAYQRTVSSLVCEEHYEQTVTRHRSVRAAGPRTPSALDVAVERRVLASDYLFVQLPGRTDWEPFRDVHTVDGTPVRDRERRLEQLLFGPGASNPWQQALAIRHESARYNIGGVVRDVNVPTFVLSLMRGEQHGRFRFTLRGRARVGTTETRIIEFVEQARPTVISGEGGTDSPARGRIWVDPDTGAILQTRLETRSRDLRTRIDVLYRQDDRLGFLVPAQMTEVHTLPSARVEGKATYDDFRQFKVETFETIGRSG